MSFRIRYLNADLVLAAEGRRFRVIKNRSPSPAVGTYLSLHAVNQLKATYPAGKVLFF